MMFRSARACPSHAPRNCSSGSPDPERVSGDKHLALQVHRTLMSIDVWLLHDAKVLKDLNIYSTLISSSPQARRSLLRSLWTLITNATRFSIDIKVLKDLKKQRSEKTVRAAARRSLLLPRAHTTNTPAKTAPYKKPSPQRLPPECHTPKLAHLYGHPPDQDR